MWLFYGAEIAFYELCILSRSVCKFLQYRSKYGKDEQWWLLVLCFFSPVKRGSTTKSVHSNGNDSCLWILAARVTLAQCNDKLQWLQSVWVLAKRSKQYFGAAGFQESQLLATGSVNDMLIFLWKIYLYLKREFTTHTKSVLPELN